MSLTPPQRVLDIIAGFDARSDSFDCGDIALEIGRATKGIVHSDDAARKAFWAEWAPWEFDTHDTPDGGPWRTYFQPAMRQSNATGEYIARPDLRTATPEIVEHWGRRAEAVKHPVLIARYADLVWDTTRFVTKGKPHIRFVRLAVEAYIAAAAIDGGAESFQTREGLTRALRLALGVRDEVRVTTVVEATLTYVERTAHDDHVGTYAYLFDNLLPPEKGPTIPAATEQRVIGFLEAKLRLMTAPGGPWDVDPHSPEGVGLRLAQYYQRCGREPDRVRILQAIAAVFERRAARISPLIALGDLQRAGELYIEAGLRDDAERVRRRSEALGPGVKASMPVVSTAFEIPKSHVDEFTTALSTLGIPGAIHWFGRYFVPDQGALAREDAEMAEKYPLQTLFGPQLLGHGYIAADVRDTTGDPDGPSVWRTSRHLQLQQMWIGWGFDHLFGAMGVTAQQLTEFIAGTPLFEPERLPIILAGVQAHLDGDYLKSVHLLIPQIEKALVNLLHHTGGATIKPHQSGRGVMQQKSLNDVLRPPSDPLANARTAAALGEDLRLYLVSALAHPKGLNVRNEVSHGMWGAGQFTKAASERVLHVLCAVSLVRPVAGTAAGNSGPVPEPGPTDDKHG